MDIDKIIRNALEEDIGYCDITTESCVPPGRKISGRFYCKDEGVICGLGVAARVFELMDGDIVFSPKAEEGGTASNGDIIAEISGPARPILSGERVALNLLQRLSGIATETAGAVGVVRGLNVIITDTRKTVPGLRILEKYAVRTGGGRNHRMGLMDGILIKDNHIAAAGGIGAAVAAVKMKAPHTLKIEVEASSLSQAREAVDSGADIIMLDNMSDAEMSEAVSMIKKAGRDILIEASGNMGGRDLRAVAESGVDIISVGALTHSARALDISLRLDI